LMTPRDEEPAVLATQIPASGDLNWPHPYHDRRPSAVLSGILADRMTP
jgi:hypothetical protein